MQYKHVNGTIASISEVENFFNLNKGTVYLGNVHESVIKNNIDWCPEPVWIACGNKHIPYSEMTHQHWSNIYHFFSAKEASDYNHEKIAIALEQLCRRFNGITLPVKEFFFYSKDGFAVYEDTFGYVLDYLGNITRLDKIPQSYISAKENVFTTFYYASIHSREIREAALIKKKSFLYKTFDGVDAYRGEHGFGIIKDKNGRFYVISHIYGVYNKDISKIYSDYNNAMKYCLENNIPPELFITADDVKAYSGKYGYGIYMNGETRRILPSEYKTFNTNKAIIKWFDNYNNAKSFCKAVVISADNIPLYLGDIVFLTDLENQSISSTRLSLTFDFNLSGKQYELFKYETNAKDMMHVYNLKEKDGKL